MAVDATHSCFLKYAYFDAEKGPLDVRTVADHTWDVIPTLTDLRPDNTVMLIHSSHLRLSGRTAGISTHAKHTRTMGNSPAAESSSYLS